MTERCPHGRTLASRRDNPCPSPLQGCRIGNFASGSIFEDRDTANGELGSRIAFHHEGFEVIEVTIGTFHASLTAEAAAHLAATLQMHATTLRIREGDIISENPENWKG